MTGWLLIGGRRVGRLHAARMAVSAAQQAALDAARTITLTGDVSALAVGKKIHLNGEMYLISGVGPGLSQRLVELMRPHEVLAEPAQAAQKFGGDRPYLKRKKGRS